jgi:pimeloyl-ACP methyl ester carboxylesterase
MPELHTAQDFREAPTGLTGDHRVITVDYRGVGDSTGTARNPMEAMAADLVAVTGPVLIVHGDSGRMMVPPQDATALARHLSAATVTVFPDSGHGVAFQDTRVGGCGPGFPAPLAPLRTITHRTP